MKDIRSNKTLVAAALASLLAGNQAYSDQHKNAQAPDAQKTECKADDKDCMKNSKDHSCKEHKCQAGKCMEGKCAGYVPKDKKKKSDKPVSKTNEATQDQTQDVKK